MNYKFIKDVLEGRENPAWILWFILVTCIPLGILLLWLFELLSYYL